MARFGFTEVIVGTVAAVTLGISCSNTPSQQSSPFPEIAGEYPTGKIVHSINELAVGSCVLKVNLVAEGPLQEMFQVRGEPDPKFGYISMVYVEPVDEADRGNLTAPHEFWFSGGRSEELLGIQDGELSIIACPPVAESKTHSNGGGFVEDHIGAPVFQQPTGSTIEP